MLALLPLAAFGIFYVIVRQGWRYPDGSQRPRREAALAALTGWFALCVLSVELFSLFHAVATLTLASFWGFVTFAGLILTWRKGWLSDIRRDLLNFPRLPLAQALPISAVLFFMAITLITALAAPPNTNDSLAYHMSRVMHWMQARAVQHYPTPIPRQLWMPPGAEMAILHLTLMAGSDHLANLVQWVSMTASLAAATLLAYRLGAGMTGQVIAGVFTVTLPMGILQSTSTQTDYVTALWVVVLAYLCLLAHQRLQTKSNLAGGELLWLGITAGLGVLTKGTFYVFALPLLAWLFLIFMRHSGWKQTSYLFFAGVTATFALNAGTWTRNWQSYSSPLGPPEGIRFLANETFSWKVVASNLVRNATLHLGTPYGVVNGPLRTAVEQFHLLISLDENDPRTTLEEFRIKRSRHEDYAGNPLHFFIILAAALILLLMRLRPGQPRITGSDQVEPARHLPAYIYALAWLGSLLLFSALFKWQPNGSRLQLPLFVAAAPLVGVALEKIRPAWMQPTLLAALLLAGLSPLLTNPSRPLLPSTTSPQTLWNAPREQWLFANSPEFAQGYLSITQATQQTGCQTIGLMLDSHDPEYPFWILLSYFENPIHIEHMMYGAPSAYQPCAIICTICAGITDSSIPGYHAASTHYGGYVLFVPQQP